AWRRAARSPAATACRSRNGAAYGRRPAGKAARRGCAVGPWPIMGTIPSAMEVRSPGLRYSLTQSIDSARLVGAEQEGGHLHPAFLVQVEWHHEVGHTGGLRYVCVNLGRPDVVDDEVLRHRCPKFVFVDLVGLGFQVWWEGTLGEHQYIQL